MQVHKTEIKRRNFGNRSGESKLNSSTYKGLVKAIHTQINTKSVTIPSRLNHEGEVYQEGSQASKDKVYFGEWGLVVFF